MMLKDGMTLYHASYAVVKNPDLQKCMANKDFGKGFYLTSDYSQAKRFVKNSVLKARRNLLVDAETDYGYISAFRFNIKTDLKIFEFERTDREWLLCIAGHRKNGFFPNVCKQYDAYDILCGKIANDNTNIVLTVFLEGGYGDIEDAAAQETAIRLLFPQKLQDQFCFKSPEAICALKFLQAEEIKWK